MEEFGLYIGTELIGRGVSATIPFIDKESPGWPKLPEWTISASHLAGMPKVQADFTYYMRRGNKYYLRNEHGKLTIETKDKRVRDKLNKYGVVYQCSFNY